MYCVVFHVEHEWNYFTDSTKLGHRDERTELSYNEYGECMRIFTEDKMSWI